MKVIQMKRVANKKSKLKGRIRKVRLCKVRNGSVLSGESSVVGR